MSRRRCKECEGYIEPDNKSIMCVTCLDVNGLREEDMMPPKEPSREYARRLYNRYRRHE